jgi:hypothetical protein
MGTETEGCVLDLHFGGERKKASQISVNRKTTHLQRLACVSITGSMHSTPTAALEVILMLPPHGIYIEEEAKQATYRLNCSGELNRARFDHSKVFEKMTDEWPFFWPQGTNFFLLLLLERGFQLNFHHEAPG